MHWQRIWAIALREFREILHDPNRISLSFIAPVILMIVFGYGMNLDIKNIPFAVIDQDHSHVSRQYLNNYQYSKYFQFITYVDNLNQAQTLFKRGKIQMLIDIQPHFERDYYRQAYPNLGIFLDGTNPFVADTAQGYVQAINAIGAATQPKFRVETRFWYNQAQESKYTFVPGMMAVILLTLPAMLCSLSIVREKELGSIMNFYVTPISRLEFIWGKQMPYVGINLINLILIMLLAIFLFRVPMQGSFLAFLTCGFLYILVSTSLGLFLSSFTKTQLAGIIMTFLITLIPAFLYSGIMTPISSLTSAAYYTAILFPTVYFANIAVGVFTKDLGFFANMTNFIGLITFYLIFLSLSCLVLKKQEK